MLFKAGPSHPTPVWICHSPANSRLGAWVQLTPGPVSTLMLVSEQTVSPQAKMADPKWRPIRSSTVTLVTGDSTDMVWHVQSHLTLTLRHHGGMMDSIGQQHWDYNINISIVVLKALYWFFIYSTINHTTPTSCSDYLVSYLASLCLLHLPDPSSQHTASWPLNPPHSMSSTPKMLLLPLVHIVKLWRPMASSSWVAHWDWIPRQVNSQVQTLKARPNNHWIT